MGYLNRLPLDENGKTHGEWVVYYDNGQLWYRENWFRGVRNGVQEVYSHDGILVRHRYWNMGRQIGYWYYLDQQKEYYLCLI